MSYRFGKGGLPMITFRAEHVRSGTVQITESEKWREAAARAFRRLPIRGMGKDEVVIGWEEKGERYSVRVRVDGCRVKEDAK